MSKFNAFFKWRKFSFSKSYILANLEIFDIRDEILKSRDVEFDHETNLIF